MRLSSLELQGFKSFPDKTYLEFGDGLTAVVGPNGSGKSNIADAIRWVFGEQSTKTLRGSKMEDVIFDGTKSRKSVGYASVKLTVDNISKIIMPDQKQITITRKLYRSGESEYRVNKDIVRLKDVHELFLDTGLGRDGYSIIAQGKIADIISAKSKQRREIFEEAAGIAKFRYRRIEASKQLDSAEENLLRLKDILIELEDRVGVLKVQSEKAKKYITLAEEKKELEISLWINSLQSYKSQLGEHEDKISIAKNDYNLLDTQSENIEIQLSENYGNMQALSVGVDNLRTQIKELEDTLANNRSKIAVYENDVSHNTENIDRLNNQLDGAGSSEDSLKKLIEDKTAQNEQINKSLEEIKSIIEQEKNSIIEIDKNTQELQQHLDNFIARKQTLDNAIAQTKIEQAANQSSISESTNRLEEIQKRDSQYDYLVNESLENLNDCNQQVEQKQQQINSLNNSLKGYELKYNSRKEKEEKLVNQQSKLEQDIKNIDSRVKILKDMETNMEGYYGSVKFILSQAKANRIQGIIGAVSSLVSTENKYVTAIEIALGAAAQNIVVENEDIAKQAIKVLKESQKGRATFLPISNIKSGQYNFAVYADEHGFIGAASSLVTHDEKITDIINRILGRTCIVDNLNTGTLIAKKSGYKFRIVTLDGQVINAGGSYTGGSVSQSSGVLGRQNEIDNLEKNKQIILAQVNHMAPELEAFSQEIASINAMVVGTNAEILTINEDLVKLGFSKSQMEKALEDAKANREYAKKELENLSERIEDLQTGKLSAEQLIEENSRLIDELESEIQQTGEDKKEKEKQSLEKREKSSELLIKEMELQKDILAIQQELERYISQSQNAKHELESFAKEIEELNIKNSEIQHEVTSLANRQKELEEEINVKNLEIAKGLEERTFLEKNTTEMRKKEREVSGSREEISRELVRLEERQNTVQRQYDEIIAKMWDEYELTRSAAQEIAQPVVNKIEASARLTQVRTAVRSLGSVNLEAMEEYEEVGQRYEFLSTQIKDVEESKAKLFKLIDELTGEMQSIFTENFGKISIEFSKIFSELFGGGYGELKLTDPNDVLESGIEIIVQPPGKVIKKLSLLSGGEQAFVAITIYFAILKVKPAPFVLLDEIEAALDDVNVAKYASYLRTLSDKIQFICITHRRGTMEEADVLYGVTMQESGVSKLLELRVHEIESKLGMGAAE